MYSRWPIFFEDYHAVEPYPDELAKVTNSTASGSEIYGSLRALGFTHVLVYAVHPEMSLPEEVRPTYLRSEFLDQFARVEFAWAGDVLYRLIDPSGLRDAPVKTHRLLTGDFENLSDPVPSEWVTIGDVTLDTDGTHALAGQGAVGTHGGSLFLYPSVPIREGGLYQLRLFAQAEQDKTIATAGIRFLAEDMVTEPIPSPPQYHYPGREYTLWEVYATAPEGARFAQILFGGLMPDHITWIDDVTFSEILPD